MFKLIFEKIKSLFPKKHDFDLGNPERVIMFEKYAFDIYKCRKCHKKLGLHFEQMLNLPRSMKYGCK